MFKVGKPPEAVRVVLAEANGDDPEAVLIFDPITPKMRRRVFSRHRAKLEQEGVDFAQVIAGEIDPELNRDLAELVTFELLRLGLREWHGIGGEDDQPLALTPDQATRLRTVNDPDRPTGTIDALLADETIFNQCDAEYVMPDARRRAEKNALSGSPSGTSAEATPASDIATLAARPKRRAAAKNAPTRSTRSRPKKAKGSGRS